MQSHYERLGIQGVLLHDSYHPRHSIYVIDVETGGPADRVGLCPGDTLIHAEAYFSVAEALVSEREERRLVLTVRRREVPAPNEVVPVDLDGVPEDLLTWPGLQTRSDIRRALDEDLWFRRLVGAVVGLAKHEHALLHSECSHSKALSPHELQWALWQYLPGALTSGVERDTVLTIINVHSDQTQPEHLIRELLAIWGGLPDPTSPAASSIVIQPLEQEPVIQANVARRFCGTLLVVGILTLSCVAVTLYICVWRHQPCDRPLAESLLVSGCVLTLLLPCGGLAKRTPLQVAQSDTYSRSQGFRPLHTLVDCLHRIGAVLLLVFWVVIILWLCDTQPASWPVQRSPSRRIPPAATLPIPPPVSSPSPSPSPSATPRPAPLPQPLCSRDIWWASLAWVALSCGFGLVLGVLFLVCSCLSCRS